MTDLPGTTEELYHLGVMAWARRDLVEARRILGEALATGSPRDDARWHSAARALSQIQMEVGDLADAERSLSIVPADSVPASMTLALRAQHAWLSGNEVEAEYAAGTAVRLLSRATQDDTGSLMNGAIALAWVADEVLLGRLRLTHAKVARSNGSPRRADGSEVTIRVAGGSTTTPVVVSR